MRLLLVEDDEMLGSSLAEMLEKNAYGVDWVRDGEEALQALENSVFAVMVLDMHLPLLPGLEVLRRLRARKNNLPVLVLTAQDSAAQKVEGLNAGADDYLTKPFDIEELLARLRALVRRSEGRTENILRCDEVELDVAAMTVRRDGASILLTAKEFRVLKMLMERKGRFVTKADIEYALYSADEVAESNTVEVTIYNLRKKLGNKFIRTMRGVGYMVGTPA